MVRAADSAVLLADGSPDALARALTTADVDTLWPGWTPAAEDPTTAAVCARLGVRFLGPDTDVLRRVRDRVAVKLLAERCRAAGRAVERGSARRSVRRRRRCRRARIPRDAQGRRRWRPSRHPPRRRRGRVARRDRTRHEPKRRHRSAIARLYVEALLFGARHLEVTVVVDRSGKVWTFGPNDATLRRRGDKVVIESARCRTQRHRQQIGARRGGDLDAAHRLSRRRHGRVRPRAGWRTASPSSRSIRDCRPSTRSSRRRPASTSCVCSCTWGSAAASTGSRPARAASPCRPGSTPRTPSGGSRRRRAEWRDCGWVPAPASGSTPPSPRAMSSRPVARCSWPRRWLGVRHGMRLGSGCGALSTRRRS